MNLENGSGGGVAVASAAVAAAALVVAKGDFSDTLLEKGEKAGDGEVFGEMGFVPSLSAAMAVAVEGGGELRVTLLADGEVIGEIGSVPLLAAAMAAEDGGELRVSLFGDGSEGEEIGEIDFLFRETLVSFLMLQSSPEKTAMVAVAVADGWRNTAEQP